MKMDKIVNRQAGKSREFRTIASPTSDIYKSSRCHRYHTDLDFNYLTNQKFLKDATSCGKQRLATVSLKTSSPDKYFYENKPTPKNHNRYMHSRSQWVNNMNITNYSKENDNNNNDNIRSSVSRSKSRDKDKMNNSGINMNNSITIQPKKSSRGILSEILDLQFSVHSPSKYKIFQNESAQLKNDEFKKSMMSLKNKSLSRDSTNIEKKSVGNNTGNIGNIGNSGNTYMSNTSMSITKENQNKIYIDDDYNTKLTINLSYVGENPAERYVDALENALTYLDLIFERLSLGEKIEKLLESTEDQKRSVSLGALVALYIILRKYQVEETSRLLVLEKTISLMQNYESQEELYLVACLEICTLFAPCEILLDNLSLIVMFITDFNFPRLQKAAFNCLMCMEYEGIRTLVDLAGRDFQDYQKYILTNLIQTPHIQKIIIIKALLNEVYSNSADRRHSALAALNRMHDLVGDTEAIENLAKFFQDNKIEKIFLSSAIRTAGPQGEKILLNEIRNNKDFSVRVAIASVLAYRLPKYPKYLKIKLDNNDTYAITKSLPGSFCTYYGKVSPYIYEKEDAKKSEDLLEVNTRDFLAALQRMLVMNYDHSNPQIVHQGNFNLLEALGSGIHLSKSSSELINKYANYFELDSGKSIQNLNNNETQIISEEEGKVLVSENVIGALCVCLRDYSTAVRDTAASSLGQIGLPESLLAIDNLVESINDEDVNVKSKVIWAIGRIAAGCDNSVIYPIVEALKSNMWKVKSTCLFALSQFGHRTAKLAMPLLMKLLKDSAINKQAIAETMVKLGQEGESVLLKLMNHENDSNYKLKSSICKAFALAYINSTNIDFIVECLFKSAKASSSIMRMNALFSIRVLAEKADERLTYLKKKNVIPFYYEKMMDKDATIQAYAISCIKSLGAQGELIFIEGLTKDRNPLIRQNSAIGLAEMGAHTLRTLLIGLHDDNLQVRRTVEKEIIDKFTVMDILECFGVDKSSQRMSLKIAIRDILEKDLPINIVTRSFFQNLLIAFENEKEKENEVEPYDNYERYNNSLYNDKNKMSGYNFVTEEI